MERMQQLQIQGELLRSKVEVQLDEAEKEFQCVDREPELSNNSKGQGEREGESEGNYFAVEKKLLRTAALGNTCCNPARKALFSSVVGAGVDGATNFLEHLSSPECLKSMLEILDGSC